MVEVELSNMEQQLVNFGAGMWSRIKEIILWDTIALFFIRLAPNSFFFLNAIE